MRDLLLFSGYKDKNGTPINHGDIVIFYFDADYGHGDEQSGYTKMVDVCFYDNQIDVFLLLNECGRGSFIFRHNKYCEVIGSVYKKEDLHLLNKFGQWLIDYFPTEFSEFTDNQILN